MKQLTFIASVCIVLISCKSTYYTYKPFNDVLNTWIGSNQNQLITQLGPPSSTNDDGNGGKVLSYNEVSYTTIGKLIPSYINGIPPRYVSNMSANNYYMQFYIDRTNKIYLTRTNYPDIPDQPYRATSTGKTVAWATVLLLAVGLVALAASQQ